MILDKPAKTNAQLLGTDIIRGSPIMGPVVSLVTGAVQMSISLDEPDCGHPTFLPGLVVAQQTLHAALRQSVQSICHRGGGGGGVWGTSPFQHHLCRAGPGLRCCRAHSQVNKGSMHL